ncbi:hypothetical protein E2K98_21965 [Bacillus salipaludis]|uniref:Uncharacterized protein n=1 Tax=Bacillus salipaludis TaxID=2547811 RepID=A0A4R5VLF8_9BACI|nr:hypothetical protein [Bacillus salipaludis]TDK58878.1 hypothetical protein E2K98_21965 [Bacillus salipaludis]
MYYRIGSIEEKKSGEHEVNITRDFTREEYDIFVENGKYLGLHLKNKHLYNLLVRNGEELESYLKGIKGEGKEDLKNGDYVIFESNRLFMNYLSMLRTYDDHISSALSQTFNPEVKDQFKSFLSELYDEFFTYRFIVRLRNLAQHFDIPISSLTTNLHGNFVIMKKDHLLKYDGWSTVKKEIKEMEEEIGIQGLAYSMNGIMHNAYSFVMLLYVENIVNACKWISSLQKEFSGKPTIIATANSRDDFKSGDIGFIQMNSKSFIDAIHDLNELPNVNIKIN